MGTANQFQPYGFEFWGGLECTINRVGDDFFDQLGFTGHYSRDGDLEKIISLGVSKLRFPILWEAHEFQPQGEINWRWAEKSIHQLRSAGVDPIAGLLHHGSGPAFTSLEDDAFPERFAAYAGRVAARFPWITCYTPVNEPLTTARFSGLYGLWYPHQRNDAAFVRMLLKEIRAIGLAMKRIREVNSTAKLIQTEDLGKTYSVPHLQYQADFENERRWLSYDLLLGRVDRSHALWDYLMWIGIGERELAVFQENPCPPDIAGFNYYLTSERYLDDELEHYPAHLHGGNHQHRYVDTEAIRIEHGQPWGLAELLKEAWDRFGLPVVVSEAFLSCTPDEQVRWLHDVLHQCGEAKASGVDLRAVTFWALLGEFGWNKLVTSRNGDYEPGAFDVRNEVPVEMPMAAYIRSVTSGNTLDIPWLNEKGWWRRSDRYVKRATLLVS